MIFLKTKLGEIYYFGLLLHGFKQKVYNDLITNQFVKISLRKLKFESFKFNKGFNCIFWSYWYGL